MPKYTVIETVGYKKSLRKIRKQGKKLSKLERAIEMLANDEPLPAKNRDHALTDCKEYKDCRECHITSDWLLIYKKEEDVLILTLVKTGSHSEMFD